MAELSGPEMRAVFGPRLPAPDPQEYIDLRARYEELTEMFVSEPIEVEVWLEMLQQLFADARTAGVFIQELTHP